MERARTKVFMVVGTNGCGKTALARRMSQGDWVGSPKPTIGLDQDVGTLHLRPDLERLRDDLHVLLPEGGIEVRLWEIGGKDFKHRSFPRGQTVDGLMLCYDIGNRSSFQTASHLLMKHRSDRHFAHDRSAVASRCVDSPAKLAVVLCGTKADKADALSGHVVSTSEQMDFVEQSGVSGAFVTSAKTGEGVEEALQAMLLACLEAEEEAEASHALTAKALPAVEMFSLTAPGTLLGADGTRELQFMSSPRSLRPHEPTRGALAAPVVEVIDQHGAPYGARSLSACLQSGLLHRVVHVWLCEPRSGGLLLRRYSSMAPKEPEHWGPSARGEVLCYNRPIGEGLEGAARGGPQSAELSFDTARRVLKEQLGFEQLDLGRTELWGSCRSHHGGMNELIEIYAIDIGLRGLPDFQLRRDEQVEWAHFMDVFGNEGMQARSLFHIADSYRAIMVQKIRVRVEHARAADSL